MTRAALALGIEHLALNMDRVTAQHMTGNIDADKVEKVGHAIRNMAESYKILDEAGTFWDKLTDEIDEIEDTVTLLKFYETLTNRAEREFRRRREEIIERQTRQQEAS